MRLRTPLPLGILLFALGACGSPRAAPDRAPDPPAPADQAPAWVDDENLPGGLAAIGIAQAGPMGDKGRQRTAAIADARTKLAAKLKVKVQSLFTLLNRQAATAASGARPIRTEALNRVIDNVTRQLVDRELPGAAARATWTDPDDGSLYLLLVMTRDNLDRALAASAKAEIRQEIGRGEPTLVPVLPRVDAATLAGDEEEDRLNAGLDRPDPEHPATGN